MDPAREQQRGKGKRDGVRDEGKQGSAVLDRHQEANVVENVHRQVQDRRERASVAGRGWLRWVALEISAGASSTGTSSGMGVVTKCVVREAAVSIGHVSRNL